MHNMFIYNDTQFEVHSNNRVDAPQAARTSGLACPITDGDQNPASQSEVGMLLLTRRLEACSQSNLKGNFSL